MRRFPLFVSAAVLAALAGGTASAQVVDDYYYDEDAPRVYRYVPDRPRFAVPRVDAYGNVYTIDRPFGRNGCAPIASGTASAAWMRVIVSAYTPQVRFANAGYVSATSRATLLRNSSRLAASRGAVSGTRAGTS